MNTPEIPKYQCNICNGTGHIIINTSTNKLWWSSTSKICPKCKGSRKLDWVEMIKGKDERGIVKVIKNGTLSGGPR